MTDLPTLSAIICTVNRPGTIGAAVESVLGNRHKDFEVLVVDQSRDDATEKALGRFKGDPRFRYLRITRVGLSAAYNLAVKTAAAPILAFTDDDCVAPPHWLSAVESAFQRHPDVELLYGETRAAPELRGEPGVLPSTRIAREEKLGRGYRYEIGHMGANFAVRRSLVERIGGFDEALGGGGPLCSSQDFDFLYRTYKAGAVCLLDPKVWVDHHGIRAPSEWPATLRAYGIGDGAFYLKHVRCRDAGALWLLLSRIARLTVREIRNAVLRRPVQWTYLRSYFTGMRMSLQYQVDRETRMYRLAESHGQGR